MYVFRTLVDQTLPLSASCFVPLDLEVHRGSLLCVSRQACWPGAQSARLSNCRRATRPQPGWQVLLGQPQPQSARDLSNAALEWQAVILNR